MNYCTLNGNSSYDPDGSITGYRWTRISGPQSIITNPDAVQTTVTSMADGIYLFELSVSDNRGATAKDTVQAIIHWPGSSLCTQESRPQVMATVTPIGKLSQARMPYVGSAGSKIVFAGGCYYTGPNYYDVSSAIDIYDINTHAWTTAKLSRAREGIAVASCGNKIFFGGGGFFDLAMDNVDIYDALTNTWTVAHLSQPRMFMAAAATESKIFFAGGYTNTLQGTSRTVDIFDLHTNSWSSIEMPNPRAEFSAVAAGEDIYFAGGLNNSSIVDVYNTVKNTWSSILLKEISGVLSGIASGDRIYWAGLAGSQNSGVPRVEIFNTKNSSQSVSCLSYSRYAPSPVVRNTSVAFFSQPIGYMGGDVGPVVNQFDIYHTTTSRWSIGMLPFAIAFQAVTQVNNTVYMAGGKMGSSSCTPEVYAVNW